VTNASLSDREPVAIGFALVAALIDAFVAIPAIAGWIELNTAQVVTICTFVTVVAMTVSAAVRDRVWSPESVSKLTHPSNGT
jgi:hypothetical protein